MRKIARLNDLIIEGLHCHGHSHGPMPSPGRIITGATRVFVEGRPAARVGDEGYSPVCCGGIGRIVIIPAESQVLIEGKSAAGADSQTLHCDMAPGKIKTGSSRVWIP